VERSGLLDRLWLGARGIARIPLGERGGRGKFLLSSAEGDSDDPLLAGHQDVLPMLYEFALGRRALSIPFIKELHVAFTDDSPVLKIRDFRVRKTAAPIRGKWKRKKTVSAQLQRNVLSHSPPEQVEAEMERLVAIHRDHEARRLVPEVAAAWLQGAFTRIHPFQDGNGRVIHALTSLHFLKAGWFALTFDKSTLSRYVAAMNSSHDGDLRPFIAFLVDLERRALATKLGLDKAALADAEVAREAIPRAAEGWRARWEARVREHAKVFALSERLEAAAEAALRAIGPAPKDGAVHRGAGACAFGEEAERAAAALGCHADTRTFLAWASRPVGGHEIVLAFHPLGAGFAGLMAATAFLRFASDPAKPRALCKEAFDFWFNEDPGEVEDRFRTWLDDALRNALPFLGA
ncbi:MAG: Fic family protein, partial [Alphaproteobacteria bacterium]